MKNQNTLCHICVLSIRRWWSTEKRYEKWPRSSKGDTTTKTLLVSILSHSYLVSFKSFIYHDSWRKIWNSFIFSRTNGYLLCVFPWTYVLPIILQIILPLSLKISFIMISFSWFYKFFQQCSIRDRSSFLTDASFTAILQAMQTS